MLLLSYSMSFIWNSYDQNHNGMNLLFVISITIPFCGYVGREQSSTTLSVCVFMFVCVYIYLLGFFFSSAPCVMQDLGSQTRDRIRTLCVGNTGP